MTTQATGPSLRETLREVDAAIVEIIRAEVADPAERERLLAKLTALSQPAASRSLVPHMPGEPHRYRVKCEVCGGPGFVQVSIEPQVQSWPSLTPAP